MNVAVEIEFKADRKEPLGDLIRRVAAQFERNGLQPEILATFSDGPTGLRSTSAVERAIRKHPHLARFERNDAPLEGAGLPPIRRLTNGDLSNPFPMADILALADGVPRSLPFHAVSVRFGHADFGRILGFPGELTPQTGIAVGDGWWVNGRIRSLSAFYAVEGDATSRKLPDPPATVGTEARLTSLGASGPLKPTLVEAFAPRGYDCRGSSGTFTLRLRTATNHIVELELDVGTWSRSLTFMFHVHGPGFNATLLPPVTAQGDARQYPIGDTSNWKQIVANIGAIVDELDRTFVAEIEAVVSPAPEWFEPGR